MNQIGELGEKFVASWLEARNYQFYYHRWHCRWGEIDLIVVEPTNNILVFVEVKTRSDRNWDVNGLLAVTEQKQKKICLSAELFLAENPGFEQFSCRFDVVLVSYQKQINPKTELVFRIRDHLEAAFDFI